MKFGEVTEKEMRKIENTALLINLFATLLNSIASTGVRRNGNARPWGYAEPWRIF